MVSLLFGCGESSNAASFHRMSDGYAPRAKTYVFYKVSIVPIRDVASHELLEHQFSKDETSAY
jgi:hypothetical protein